MDSSKIQIVSAKKISGEELVVGKEGVAANKVKAIAVKEEELDEATIEERKQYIRDLYKTQSKCSVCCAVQGAAVAMPMSFILSCITTGCYIFWEKKINYTINSAMKQVVWLALPGMFVASTLHYFMSEAMWSKNKNSWGTSWARAISTNTIMWATAIGASTFAWRVVLPKFPAGKRLYYRNMCPADTLEIRQMRNPDAFFKGMNWVYFASGLLSGQVGFSAAAALGVYQNKTHFFMSPTGSYSKACMPAYRIEAMLRNVNFIPSVIKTSTRTIQPAHQPVSGTK